MSGESTTTGKMIDGLCRRVHLLEDKVALLAKPDYYDDGTPGEYGGDPDDDPIDPHMSAVDQELAGYSDASKASILRGLKQTDHTRITNLDGTRTPTDDGWIDWHGGMCPVASLDVVDYERRNGVRSSTNAGVLLWRHPTHYGKDGDSDDIIRYRVVKETPKDSPGYVTLDELDAELNKSTPDEVVEALKWFGEFSAEDTHEHGATLAAAARELSWALMYSSRKKCVRSDVDRYTKTLNMGAAIYDSAVEATHENKD